MSNSTAASTWQDGVDLQKSSKKNNSTSGNKILIIGEDWNEYFRETYKYENVNWESAYDSPNDIIEMPSTVTRMNPQRLYNYLTDSGFEVGTLGEGLNEGILFINGGRDNVHFKTKYGNSYIQYNPSSGHHNSVPYYKVSSGKTFSYTGIKTGTQRFYLNGGVISANE